MAGDFNMKLEEWFASCADRKGALLSEFATFNRLVVMNDSTDKNHFLQGFGPHIDVTFASESLAQRRVVLQKQSGSDCNYIHFIVERRTMVAAPKKVRRWTINNLHPDRLEAMILATKANQ